MCGLPRRAACRVRRFAVRLASWAGLNLSAVDISNLRLAMMELLPNLAGLVLAFGVAFRGGRRS